VLFGSRARGDASQGSDYDVLLLVDERTPDLEDALLDLGAAMLDQHGALFAAVVRSEREWSDAQGFPLAMNIVREGLAL
jgi:predicted nucleotidyltransferase